MKEGCIRIRIGKPDYSDLPDQEYDWGYSEYGNVKEITPDDCPTPKGRKVVTTSYEDASLYHDYITGRAVTASMHFVNQTLIDFTSKRQATVETATYGAEFVAARITVDQIIDLRNTLRYLGVPIENKSIMFGDNRSVVDSSTLPHSTLTKRHHALCFHRVCKAIASKAIGFYWIDGTFNPADTLSKHWGMSQAWPLLRPILFCRGDTHYSDDKENKDPNRTNGECDESNKEEESSMEEDNEENKPTEA